MSFSRSVTIRGHVPSRGAVAVAAGTSGAPAVVLAAPAGACSSTSGSSITTPATWRHRTGQPKVCTIK